ncbi:MAG: hypothetical protein CVU51_05825 [Deltaproteobacteria bacterium HGW-Deltaproteobacteria-1]|nr:MAG: hypothetical protein CVU51_05825 [Deltaproteobacteria bacterium HGW-Deltaproteobacteria-1]
MEEADPHVWGHATDANKVSQRPEAHSARKRKKKLFLPYRSLPLSNWQLHATWYEQEQPLIYFRNISLSFLDKQLFDQINWTIHPKSRIGLVGDNGTGKTTLFRAILDQVHPDSGFIDIPDRKQKKIGYLPQDLVELEATGLIEYLRRKSGIARLEGDIRSLEEQISKTKPNTHAYSELTRRYADATAEFSARDGYAFEARAKQILKGFGFRENDFIKTCAAG